jgi:hypothetical protein
MTILYKKVVTSSGATVINATFTDSDKLLSIPMNEENTDYQAYLVWLSKGNTPESVEVIA